MFPKVGVEIVTPGSTKAINELRRVDSQLNKTNASLKQTGKQSSGLIRPTNNLSKAFGGLSSKMGALPSIGGGITSMLGGMGGQVTALAGSMGGLITVVAGLTAAFTALGLKGFKIQGQAQAFGNTVASLGDPTGILNDLRSQTRGTVSDLELMELTLKSLQGTTTEFRDIVAPNLGKVFDVTQRAAAATGQNAEVVREKFLLGLRRQSNLLLDDIGITVDATRAQENYARQLGITADELTEAQKQAAFAQDAISQLDRISQEVGGIGSFTEMLQQVAATLQNIINQVALAILPVFEPIANAFMQIMGALGVVMQDIIVPIIYELSRLVGGVLSAAFKFASVTIGAVFYPVIRVLKPILTNLIAIFSLVVDAITALFDEMSNIIDNTFGPIAKEVDKFFDWVEDTIDDYFVNLAYAAGLGSAAFVGALAAGIYRASSLVVEAVTFIASIVADFLEGLSPPKKGPLKNIDKGGENVIKAWAGGMLGGVIKPVSEVAAFVEKRLGAIGRFSREQVAARLAQLDAAILPFKNSLAIIEADMKAIAGYVDPATRILERQRKAALEALRTGEGDLETTRALDRQIAQLQEVADLRQDAIDKAQLNLAVAEAQQAQERALLEIQKARLGEAPTEDIDTGGGGGGRGGAAPSPRVGGGGGGGGGIPTEELPGAGFMEGEAPDLLGDEDGLIEQTKSRISDAFERGITEGFEASGFTDAQEAASESMAGFNEQIGRIAETEVGGFFVDAITEMFDSVFGEGGAIQTALDFFSDLISDPGGTLKSALSSGKKAFTNFANDVSQFIGNLINIDLSGAFDNLSQLLSDPTGTILGAFSDAKEGIEDFSDDVSEKIKDLIGVDLSGAFDNLSQLLSDPAGMILGAFSRAKIGINNFAADVSKKIKDLIGVDLSGAFDNLSQLLSDPAGTILGAFSRAKIGINNFAADVSKKIKDLIGVDLSGQFDNLSQLLSDPTKAFQSALTAGKDAISGVGGFAEDIRTSIADLIGVDIDAALTDFQSMLSDPSEIFQSGLSSAITALTGENGFTSNIETAWHKIFGGGEHEGILPGAVGSMFINLGVAIEEAFDKYLKEPLEKLVDQIEAAFKPDLSLDFSLPGSVEDVARGAGTLGLTSTLTGGGGGGGFGGEDIVRAATGPLGAVILGGGSQQGTSWTGDGPITRIAGYYHAREAVIPAHGMRIYPGKSGLRLEGVMDMAHLMTNAVRGAYTEGMSQAVGMAPTYNTSNTNHNRSMTVGNMNFYARSGQESIVQAQEMAAFMTAREL